MKFLVVGLGSMGKRRVRNLQYLKAGEIIGFDPRSDRRNEAAERYSILTVPTFEAGIAMAPDAVIISTPPDLHMAYARPAALQGKHFFVEASVNAEGMDEVIDLCAQRSLVAAPSCTMRFHPMVRTLKKLLDSGDLGRVLACTYHSGQYLPDWHPWEDIRDFYVSRRATGGGREIVPFELTWLTWLLGPVQAVTCMYGKVSDLPADIDDVYQVVLKFSGGALGHLLVDVVARAPIRHFRLLTAGGVIEWNWSENVVRTFSAASGKWRDYREPMGHVEPGYIHGETMYVEEMAHFLRAVRGDEPFPYTLAEDRAVLDLLLAAERSSQTGRHVRCL